MHRYQCRTLRETARNHGTSFQPTPSFRAVCGAARCERAVESCTEERQPCIPPSPLPRLRLHGHVARRRCDCARCCCPHATARIPVSESRGAAPSTRHQHLTAAAAAAAVAALLTAAGHPLLPDAGTLLLQLASCQVCRQQLSQVDPRAATDWVDVATPAEACTKQLPGFERAYQLVFSDEFNTTPEDRNLK